MSKKWTAKKVNILYFVVQRIGSLMILVCGLLSDWGAGINKWTAMGLLLKTSIAPLHFWGTVVITNLRNILALIFLTWQKIAPLILLFITSNKGILKMVMIVNVLIATSCSIGSQNLYVILFFSGLIHVGWILTAPSQAAIVYFLLYCSASVPIFYSQDTTNLSLLLLNLAGLPPLTGFFIKLSVLQLIRVGDCIFLLSMTGPLLYVYVRTFLRSSMKLGNLKYSSIIACFLGMSM